MLEIPELKAILESVPHSHILETGSYKGLGSTALLASLNPMVLISIESNIDHLNEAKRNRPEPFIEWVHGLSAIQQTAIAWLNSFVPLINHENYPDVFIDGLPFPKQFYLEEISKECPDGALFEYLPKIKDFNPIILLDSCGGIGFLEFCDVHNFMAESPYTIVLDDTDHIKHFKSKENILADKNWTVLFDKQGILIAQWKKTF